MSHELVAFRCMVCIWAIVPTNGTNRMSTMSSKVMLLGRMQCRLNLYCMVILRPVKREEQLLLAFNLTSDHRCSLLRYFIINLRHPIDDSRELKQRRRRRRRERQKSYRFILAKQQLCTCITLFCTLLCRRCTTTTWKCLISRFVKDKNFLFLFLNFDTVLRIQLQKNISSIWGIKQDGISAIKFEAARIHFLSDVFVALDVVVA